MPRLARYLLFVCFASSINLVAQVDFGSLSGHVTDPAQASVKGAKVTATNTAIGVERSTLSDESGYYFFSSLPVGKYAIAVSQPGFTQATSTASIDPSEKGRLDFQLIVGATSTSVEVQAAGNSVSHDDASVGTVIENQVIESTPLFLRNWDDLIRLVPGVQQNRYPEQSGATASGRSGDFQIHGIHSLQNDFILDGIDDNTFSENVQELSAEGTRPSVDVIQEFKVITNPYSAEYGRSPGAVVDVSTRSGNNQAHGLLFEYLRNRIFDANDFFSNKSGLKSLKTYRTNSAGMPERQSFTTSFSDFSIMKARAFGAVSRAFQRFRWPTSESVILAVQQPQRMA